MSNSKNKGGHGTPEVHTARSKLDGVLQTLMDKKEDSPIKEELRDDYDSLDEGSSTTPSKRSKQSKVGRKRKRGDDEGQEFGQYHHTYVMKLFDRSVDLAQFEDSTPLYPVCRAWMKNQPHNQNLFSRMRTPTPEPDESSSDDSDEDDIKPVYRLPSPVSIKTETGHVNYDCRVPSPIPLPENEPSLDEIYENPAIQPAPEMLLLNHMDRWKHVRLKWKEASRLNEARYTPSLTILKAMHDRNNKD